MSDHTSFIIAYESGQVDEDSLTAGFQALIDDGTICHLQGHYQRTAHDLIEAGYCTAPTPAPAKTLS
jgi:hypothetical protein